MSYTSPHVAVVVAGLTQLEQSFQRLDSSDARALLVRDARQTICQLDAAAQGLLRWKDEALTVLVAWEKVWVAAGRPGPLGRSMAENTAAEISRLRAAIDALIPEPAAALDVDECGNNRTTVQAHFDDESGLWAFYEDPDPETDFAAGEVAATIPVSLWQQFEANAAEYDRLTGLIVEAANLDPAEGRRVKPCDAFTQHRIPDVDDPCTTCGYSLDLHEDISLR
jgi:hypothetical protein